MRRASATVVAVAALGVFALGVVGCGGDDDSPPAGPELASAVPADALVYAEAVVRADKATLGDAEAALGHLLGVADVGAEIRTMLNESLADAPSRLSYEQDIEPWLGERAAFFANDFDEDSYAMIAETRDPDAAAAANRSVVEAGGDFAERSYRGVEYLLETDGDFPASGIVENRLVGGSEAGLRAVVDAASGDSLADSEDFARAMGDPPDGALLTAYASADAAAAVADSAQLEGDDPEAVAELVEEPLAGYAGGEANGFFLEIQGISGGGEGELLERAPADAWLAVGAAELGPRLRPILELGAVANEASLRTLAGLQLETLAGAVGDGLGYVSGESVLGIGGALAFEVTDEEAAATALASLRDGFANDRALTVEPGDSEGEEFSVGLADAPIVFPFVHRDGLLVVGLGEAAVEQVLEPESRLGDSPAYEAAADALGDDFVPILLLDFEPLQSLLGGIPDAASDPGLAAALPYIERLDQFAVGTADDGLRFTLRVDE